MSNTLNVHLQGAMGGGQGRAVHDKGGGKFSCCDLVGNEPQRDTLADRETTGRVVVVVAVVVHRMGVRVRGAAGGRERERFY